MLLPLGIVEGNNSLSLVKEGLNVPYAEGDKEGSIEAPFSLCIQKIQTALISAAV